MIYCRMMTHTIKPGDTLYLLAEQYRTTVPSIVLMNPGINPYNLKVGEKLKICMGEDEMSPQTPPQMLPQTPPQMPPQTSPQMPPQMPPQENMRDRLWDVTGRMYELLEEQTEILNRME